MKLLLILTIASVISFPLFGQSGSPVFYYSAASDYSKTDFSKVDSLGCWVYILRRENLSYEDSVKPVGQLTFQRTHRVKEGKMRVTGDSGFLPTFTFQVFELRDSAYCFRRSILSRELSSCLSPDVGGDMIFFGGYIFLNVSVCLRCKNDDNGVDYCRPVINKLFLGLDKSKANTLDQIVRQFPIKGQLL